MTWASVTPCRRSRSGSTCTWSCWSRRPQIETLATPGTPIRRGRTVHRAMTDCSIGDTLSDARPIIRTRLDDESGGEQSRRLGHVGQRVRLSQPLLHELPGAVDVGAGREHEHDRRQPRHGLRADHLDALDAVEEVGLERHRDELLDLVGRQAEGLGLDLGVRRRELGQHVDRCAPQLDDADDRQAGGDTENEQTEVQYATQQCTHDPTPSPPDVRPTQPDTLRRRLASV